MKRLFVWFLVMLALVMGASAADSVDLGVTSLSMEIAEHVDKTGSITLTNKLGTALTGLSISVGDLTSGTNTIASATQIVVTPSTVATLAASGTQTVNVKVTVPDAQAVGTYTGTITVTYTGGTDASATSTLTVVVVAQAPDFGLPTDVTFDEALSNTTVTKTFTVTNNGNTPLTGITITSDADAKYTVAFTNVPTSLAIGASTTVTVTAKIPSTETAGTKTIGNVNVSGTGVDTPKSETFPLKIKVGSRLAIDDLDVKVDSDTSNNLEDGNRIGDEALPESTVKFLITVENRYTNEQDVDIEDIVVTVTIEDIDNGDDMEEESDEFDLDADSREKVTIEFNLPLEVEENDYNVVILLEGEDDNGNTLSEERTLTLRVDKKSHAVKIRKASLSSAEIMQGDNTVLSVEIINLGSASEDEVVLEIKNSNLGLNIKQENIELDDDLTDEDCKYRKTATIDTSESLAPGTYPIEIRSYYDEDNLDDIKTVNLVVKAKQAAAVTPVVTPTVTPTVTGQNGGSIVVVTSPTEKEDTTIVPETTTTVTETKESFFDSPFATALIGVGAIAVVLMVGIVVLLFKLLLGGGLAK